MSDDLQDLDPTFGQNFEAFHVVTALDDFEPQSPMANNGCNFANQFSGVSTVGPNHLQPAEGLLEFLKQEESGSVTILHIRRGDVEEKNEAESVYQNVSFSSCNFLTRIITTNSGVASCANALAVNDRSGRGFFFPALSRARSRR